MASSRPQYNPRAADPGDFNLYIRESDGMRLTKYVVFARNIDDATEIGKNYGRVIKAEPKPTIEQKLSAYVVKDGGRIKNEPDLI